MNVGFNALSEQAKHTADLASVGTVAATLFGWLPQISALLAAGWLVVRLATSILEYRIKQQEYSLNKQRLSERQGE